MTYCFFNKSEGERYMEKTKNELVGAVEYAKMKNAEIEIPDSMWFNLIREGDDDTEGHLRIETLGDDVYKITKVKENQIPIRNIAIPETVIQQIKRHIDDDAVKRDSQYTSVEDLIFKSIKQNIEMDREMYNM